VQSHWRKAKGSDLPGIMTIGAEVHPGLPERVEVIAEKMRLCPDACRVLVSDGDIVGYGLAHFWTLHRIPPLDEFLHELPPFPDCLHVHDVAVLPTFRGGHVADAYVEAITEMARSARIAHLALISVYDTAPFWARFGFRVVAPDAALRKKLESYCEGAAYMISDLRQPQNALV
jgi:GNAT superfamily N-acetyltransferase